MVVTIVPVVTNDAGGDCSGGRVENHIGNGGFAGRMRVGDQPAAVATRPAVANDADRRVVVVGFCLISTVRLACAASKGSISAFSESS